jgi:hypothetical protein
MPTAKPRLKDSYAATFNAIKQHPLIAAPFFIFAALETVFLFILFLAPREPLIRFLGPPIRTFWGEKFLHYPFNFLLLPKLDSLSRMGLSVFFGSLLTGIAVAIAASVYLHSPVNFKASFRAAAKKYLSLLAVVLLITTIFYAVNKITTLLLLKYFVAGHDKLLFIPAAIWLGPISIVINLVLALFIQALFTYAIPAIIVDNAKLLPALFRSMFTFKRFFLTTLGIIALPMLIYLPIIVLNINAAFLIDKAFPEIILAVSIAGIIINAVIIDALITLTTAFLYLRDKENRK